MPTQQFLDTLGFTPADPPNAALVAQTDGGEDVLVLELINPQYDATSGQLTYEVRPLENYQELGLRFVADRQSDLTMPASFGEASLFIDDCPDGQVWCSNGSFGHELHGVGMCWSWKPFGCHWCRDYSSDCNATFSQGNGTCTAYCSGATC